MIKLRLTLLTLIAGPLAFCAADARAAAACLPGLPCVVGKTINDPDTPGIEPNLPGAPNADKNDSNLCDADFMNQIYARAYLESVRETTMEQVVIRKPDSVLEYTCFGHLATLVGEIASPIFSGSDEWQGASVPIGGGFGYLPSGPVTINVFMGEDRLGDAIEAMVLAGLDTYLTENFVHTFLGGTGPSASATAGACDFMNSVHFLAKCTDFATDDQLLSFESLASLDPRQLPAACTATKITTDLINVAANTDLAYADLTPVATYLERLIAGECGAPIPTGIVIIRDEYDVSNPIGDVSRAAPGLYEKRPYEEYVCTNPGCYYDIRAGECQ